MQAEKIIKNIRRIAEGNGDSFVKLQDICNLLKREVDVFDWVGFYLIDKEKEKTLVLGPFAGAPTEHVSIGFGQGICGQAAETGRTFIVQDVSKQSNYLSCSIDVRSEIVVPVYKDNNIIGELDIDSHSTAPFTDEHEKMLNEVAEIVYGIIV